MTSTLPEVLNANRKKGSRPLPKVLSFLGLPADNPHDNDPGGILENMSGEAIAVLQRAVRKKVKSNAMDQPCA